MSRAVSPRDNTAVVFTRRRLDSLVADLARTTGADEGEIEDALARHGIADSTGRRQHATAPTSDTGVDGVMWPAAD